MWYSGISLCLSATERQQFLFLLKNFVNRTLTRTGTVKWLQTTQLCMNSSFCFLWCLNRTTQIFQFIFLITQLNKFSYILLTYKWTDWNQLIFVVVFKPKTLQQSSNFFFLTHSQSLKNCEPNLNRLTDLQLNSQTVC